MIIIIMLISVTYFLVMLSIVEPSHCAITIVVKKFV